MRKLKQRLFSLLLCAAMLVSLCAPAAAEETGTYWTWDDEQETLVEKNIPDPITEVTTGTTELDGTTTGGWYIVRGTVEISSRVTVTGDVHLILADGCALTTNSITLEQGASLTICAQSEGGSMGRLTAHYQSYLDAGIEVSAGSTLTINGGKVTATGWKGAGIGGSGIERGISGDGGNIIINGGTVTATSDNGAGIGGGSGNIEGNYVGGDGGIITINGGTVKATGGGGAGIGGGYGDIDDGICGNGGIITITGGKVEAIGSIGGAGIGGGNGGAGGEITISGGTVTATSNGNGAGIGGGSGGDGGTITINGGAVSAESSTGAGIGGGFNSTTGGIGGDGGTITITGGAVTATSNDGAGIGGGSGDQGSSGGNGGTIIISGGTVTASSGGGTVTASSSGGMYGLGIYSGSTVTISGGTVTASGSGGMDGNGIYSNSTITITGGTVTASGSGQYFGYGIHSNSTVTITGGTVTASGSYGISSHTSVKITGGTVTSSANAYGIWGAFSTGTKGSAFIVASSIEDLSGKDQWSGVIFEGNSGKVYGSEITLAADAEIPADRTLKIEEGQTLIVGADVTLTNNGEITNDGTINNNGTIINNGTISGDGITVNNGTITGNAITGNTVHEAAPDAEWQHDGSGHWHPCKVEGCTAHKFDTAAHTPGDWIVDRAATSSEAGQRHRECTVCGYVTQTETIPATGEESRPSGGGSYTTPTYPPTVEKPGEGGGTPTVSPSSPKQGDTVTVTPKPDDGYEVDAITVTDRSGKPVEVTQKPDGTYTFKQPSGKVTIEVTYQPIDWPWNNPFADVSEGDWYYEAVRFAQERGLMNGYNDGRFGPNDTLSRAQLAQILFNKEGGPVVNYLMRYGDVAGEAWYAEAVRWATSQGIVGGYGNGLFGPNDPITREQLAVMLWRYSGCPAATDKELHFADTDAISGYALEALRWAVENGILNGYSDGRLAPQGQATRAQVAQMLKNFIENQEDDEIQ